MTVMRHQLKERRNWPARSDRWLVLMRRQRPWKKNVAQSAAINFDELVHGDFGILLEEGCDFVFDVVRKVSRTLW